MFEQATLKQRLVALGALLTALLILGGAAALFAVHDQHRRMEELRIFQGRGLEAVRLAESAVSDNRDQIKEYKNMLMRGADPALFARHRKGFDESAKRVQDALGRLVDLGPAFGVPREEIAAAISAHAEMTKRYAAALDLYDAKKLVASIAAVDTNVQGVDRPVTKGFSELVRKLSAQVTQESERSSAAAAAAFRWTWWLVIGLTAIGVALFGIPFLIITRGLLRELGGEPGELVRVARRIADGDLSQSLAARSGDTTSAVAVFALMQQRLRELVARLGANAQELGRAAAELSSSSAQIKTGAEHGSEAASSMAASVEQLSVSIDHAAAHAGDALKISRESGDLSCQGADIVTRTATEMEDIARAATELTDVITRLGEQSAQISRIVSVIQEIANQTNLLALNAAIEAARAGEQGRGFSVVSDEVRKLAERTAQSTREISAMIESIQAGTQRAVSHMAAWGDRVARGVSSARGAGETMVTVKSGAGEVVRVMSDITNTLAEQSSASSQLASNVEKIAQMSEENAAAIKSVAAAATQLDALAQTLAGIVGTFRTGAAAA
jgi:methyl-accepting chemotaxis protein